MLIDIRDSPPDTDPPPAFYAAARTNCRANESAKKIFAEVSPSHV